MDYTDDFTRQGILDAVRKRHTYGATDNILLEVRAGRYFMGDEFQTERPLPIHVRAVASSTAPSRLEAVSSGPNTRKFVMFLFMTSRKNLPMTRVASPSTVPGRATGTA